MITMCDYKIHLNRTKTLRFIVLFLFEPSIFDVLDSYMPSIFDSNQKETSKLLHHRTVNVLLAKFLLNNLGAWLAFDKRDEDAPSVSHEFAEKFLKRNKKTHIPHICGPVTSNIALAVACFLDPRYKKKLVEYFINQLGGLILFVPRTGI
ncbi:hypothetical protein ACJX0J_013685, partial [Zea mays]